MTRKVSVGLIEPEYFDDDTIYVTLAPHGGAVYAEAISKEEFYFDKKVVKRGKTVNNYKGNSLGGTPLHVNDWHFIEMLEEENDGEVDEHRIKTDGLKLSGLVQETHYKTGIIKTF